MQWIFLALGTALFAMAGERQLTQSARNHALDNNDNFSADDRYLCFDTRGSGQAVGRVDLRTGEEKDLFAAGPTVVAASYHPNRGEVVFIHGPVSEPYAKTNRRGAVVDAAGKVSFLDLRDAVSPVTPPGAHRGGTHRHEFSPDGLRVGFTYDDHLLPEYGRTVGMLVPHRKAPAGATHWFVVLVPVVPQAAARPGDLVMASGDSWVGEHGLMRAFIGRVKEADGSFHNSLFVVDVPADVDVTTAFAGDSKRFPAPPRGTRIRRLTQGDVSGIVRGSHDGKWIAYVAKADDGTNQVFVIDSEGKTARQVTKSAGGVQGNVRWHPSGRYVAVSAREGILVANVESGDGKLLTTAPGDAIVWSHDGKTLAFNRKVGPYQQIFLATF